MCLVFVAETAVPTLEQMERAESSNPDGAGIAWREMEKKGGKESFHVRWKKNLTAKEVHELIKERELEKFLPSSPFVVHFRFASSGGKHPELTQPFPIREGVETSLEGTAERVLFHNGTFTMWDDMMRKVCWSGNARIPGGKWNDTRSLAWLAFHRGHNALFLTNWGGGHSSGRIAVLSSDGKLSLDGDGWIQGETKGVMQSGTLPTPKGVYEVDDWREIYQGRGRGRYRSSSEVEKYKILRPLKSTLYEEGDDVECYSIQEINAIVKDLKEEQDAMVRVVS